MQAKFIRMCKFFCRLKSKTQRCLLLCSFYKTCFVKRNSWNMPLFPHHCAVINQLQRIIIRRKWCQRKLFIVQQMTTPDASWAMKHKEKHNEVYFENCSWINALVGLGQGDHFIRIGSHTLIQLYFVKQSYKVEQTERNRGWNLGLFSTISFDRL